jgi:hypothetical protein
VRDFRRRATCCDACGVCHVCDLRCVALRCVVLCCVQRRAGLATTAPLRACFQPR